MTDQQVKSDQGSIATFVRKLEDFTGDARLYTVEPPIHYGYWDDDADDKQDGTTSHVIVSATVVPYGSGPETYIFPADDKGEVVDWGELDGSFRGALDHEQALRNAGYEVAR